MAFSPRIRQSGVGWIFGGPTLGLVLAGFACLQSADAFEGQIEATFSQSGRTNDLKYTVGSEHLRIEVTGSSQPNSINIMDRQTGELTLLFPHNHSFLRLPPAASQTAAVPGVPGMPVPPGGWPVSMPTPGPGPSTPPFPLPANLPPGIGPQSGAFRPGPGAAMPGMPGIPAPGPQAQFPGALPPPMMADQYLTLTASGRSTNILGFPCQQFELKGSGETVEIWATDQLFAFQPYAPNQPRRLGPSMLEERWPGLVADRKLFPMIASGRFNSGAERFRFEVTEVNTNPIVEPDAALFQPPADYHEIQPLPF